MPIEEKTQDLNISLSTIIKSTDESEFKEELKILERLSTWHKYSKDSDYEFP